MSSANISSLAFSDPANLQNFINKRVAEKEETQQTQIDGLKKQINSVMNELYEEIA
jgi:hypothetical protein